MTIKRATEDLNYVASKKPIDAGAVRQLSVVRKTFALAAETTSDTLRCYLPEGFRPVALGLAASASLGSSTLAIGPSGSGSKYRAAAVLTAPSWAPVPYAAQAKLTAQEEVIFTIGAATLPTGETLIAEFWGTYD